MANKDVRRKLEGENEAALEVVERAKHDNNNYNA